MAGLKNMTQLKFDKRILVLGVIVSMIIPFQAASANHITVPEGVFALDDGQDSFYLVNSSTGEPDDEITLNFGEGGLGLAIHPTTSHFYASFIVDPVRVLATIDPISPYTVTQIGTGFSDGTNDLLIDTLEFRSDGTLFGVTDDTLKQLYTIPLDGTDATLLCTFSDVELGAISFNTADILYGIYGDPPVLQTINTTDCDATTIATLPISGAYFTSLTFTGNNFLGGTSNGDLYTVSPDGSTVTRVNSTPGDLPVYGGIVIFSAGANQPPVTVPDSYSTLEDTVLNIPAPGQPVVLANDIDPEGDPMTAVLDSTTSNGILLLNPDGSFTYTPNLNFFGSVSTPLFPPDSFTYHADDGAPGNMVTVTIDVTQVQDPPTAVDDFGATDADTVLNEAAPGVLDNDIDPDPNPQLKVDSNTSPSAEGAIVTVNLDGSYTYDPTTSASLSALAGGDTLDDTFDYTMSDVNGAQDSATVTITVTGVNVGIFVEPEFQENLTDKMIKQFKKKIYNWEHRIDKLEYKIVKLEAKAAKALANGNLERAAWLTAKAGDKQDKIEILEDFISITKISIGIIPEELVPVELQENLLPKSVEKIEHKIIKWMYKIEKLNHRADNLEEKAEHYSDKGNDKKAKKLLAKAYALRDKAEVFEDLNEVLIAAIDFVPSDVKLHDKYDHKDKYNKEDHS